MRKEGQSLDSDNRPGKLLPKRPAASRQDFQVLLRAEYGWVGARRLSVQTDGLSVQIESEMGQGAHLAGGLIF